MAGAECEMYLGYKCIYRDWTAIAPSGQWGVGKVCSRWRGTHHDLGWESRPLRLVMDESDFLKCPSVETARLHVPG